MKNLRIIIVDSDDLTRKAIQTHLSSIPGVEIVGDSRDATSGHRMIRQQRPDLVVVEATGVDDAGMRLAADVHQEIPGIVIFVTSAHKNPDIILKAMSSGAKEFLLRPVELHVLTKAIDKVLKDPARLGEWGGGKGRILTFFSNKGGVGTTTLATNTAAAFMKEGLGTVGLVDLDLQLGNAASFLNLVPKYTVYDLTAQLDKVTPQTVDSFLAKHECGIAVLGEPRTPSEAEAVTPQQLTRALELLRSTYAFVVVDTPKGFDERTLEVLDTSDEIFVVTELSLPALRNLKKCLDVFRDLQYSETRVRVLVNRFDPKSVIRLEDVEQNIGFTPYWKFPNDFFRVMNGINTGAPVVTSPEESDFGRSVVQFCRKVVGKGGEVTAENGKAKGGYLKRIFGKRQED